MRRNKGLKSYLIPRDVLNIFLRRKESRGQLGFMIVKKGRMQVKLYEKPWDG